MINSQQVSTRLGKKTDGTPVYSSLNKIVDGKLPVVDSTLFEFNLASASDVHALGTGEFPAGDVYVDGSTYEGINGGIATANVASIGTASLNSLTVGERVVNLVRVLDSLNDEVVVNTQADGEVRDAKLVYAFIQSPSTDGTVVDDTNLQLSFVVFDDVTSKFVSYALDAGDYKYQPVRMYTVGTASEADKLSAYLTGKAVGGFALDEILALTKGGHGTTNFTFTDEITPSDKKSIKVQFIDASTAKLFVDGVEVTVVDLYQEERKSFDAINFNKPVSTEEMTIALNGDLIAPMNTVIVDKDTFTFDISKNVSSTFAFYINDSISIRW